MLMLRLFGKNLEYAHKLALIAQSDPLGYITLAAKVLNNAARATGK